MLRHMEREKVERIIVQWKQHERRLERELGALRTTLTNKDALVYDGTVDNQRMLAAIGRRLYAKGFTLRCWSDPHRNEFRVWVERH